MNEHVWSAVCLILTTFYFHDIQTLLDGRGGTGGIVLLFP